MPTVLSPDYESPAYQAMKSAWTLARQVRGGTEAFRKDPGTLLPRYDVETPGDWSARVKQTFIVSFLEQAIGMSIGLVTKYDPELGDDVPDPIAQDWEDLDGEGNHGAVVAQMAMDAALQDGHHLLITEYPPAAGVTNLAEERASGLRPYVVRVGIDQVVSWRSEIRGAARVLTQLVIKETVEQSDGPFAVKMVTRYRVYRDSVTDGITWELWDRDAAANAFTPGDSGKIVGPTRIPVAVVYGGKQTGLLTSKPPFDDLTQANVRWAQVESERARTLYKAGVILLSISGELQNNPETGKPPTELSLTQGGALMLKAGGSAAWIEPAGSALEQQRAERDDLEKRMASLALAVLRDDPVAPETATATRHTQSKEESVLQRLVRSTKDALEQTLIYMAQYRNLPTENLTVTLRRDFARDIAPDTIEKASALEEKGQLTMGSLLRLVERSGIMGDDFKAADEEKALSHQAVSEPGLPMAAALTDAELAAELDARQQARNVNLNGQVAA